MCDWCSWLFLSSKNNRHNKRCGNSIIFTAALQFEGFHKTEGIVQLEDAFSENLDHSLVFKNNSSLLHRGMIFCTTGVHLSHMRTMRSHSTLYLCNRALYRIIHMEMIEHPLCFQLPLPSCQKPSQQLST